MNKDSSESISTMSHQEYDVNVMDSAHSAYFIDKLLSISFDIVEHFHSYKNFIRELAYIHCSITSLA